MYAVFKYHCVSIFQYMLKADEKRQKIKYNAFYVYIFFSFQFKLVLLFLLKKKIPDKCMKQTRDFFFFLFIIFQIDVCTESQIKLGFQIAHRFLNLLAFFLDGFDLFQLLFLGIFDEFLCRW